MVGTVARVDHLPAQDLLAVDTADGEVLVPFVKAIVPSVDIEAGIVTVTPPAGLFEELPDDEPEPAGDIESASDAEPAPDGEADPTPTHDEDGDVDLFLLRRGHGQNAA